MKAIHSLTLSILLASQASSAFAHDAGMHMQDESPAPDCAQMKDMDSKKMDKDDPLMKALMEQCKGSMGHGDMQGDDMRGMPGMAPPTGAPNEKGAPQ